MISEKSVAEILDTARIEEVIGDYVNLKKRGSNYLGLCPFHNEKTPSFSVSHTKGIYKCFGCGEAGNTVSFLMNHEHMTYPDSLRHLAQKYNIAIEENFSDEQQKKALEEESLFIITEFAKTYYSNALNETEEGKTIGLSYFKERAYREDTIEKFGLGYASKDNTSLLKEATRKGHNSDLLLRTGLIKDYNGKKVDFFRDRVIFPIFNVSGKVIAFAGRTLSSDKKVPKYVNSPETDIYHKSNVLYGVFQARRAIRAEDMVYLVEGYTDVISLHQEGVENVVASSGTSLTQGQAQLIKRYTNNVCLLFDGDAAGMKAAIRGVDIIIAQGLNVKIVILPEGEDPDSYLKKAGQSAFKTYLEDKADDFILFKTKLFLDQTKKDPTSRANLIREIVSTIGILTDPIDRSVYTRECSKLLEVPEDVLIREINKIRRESFKSTSGMSNQESQQVEQNTQVTAPTQQEKSSKGTEKQELDILRLLLHYGDKEFSDSTDVAQHISKELNQASFTNPLYKRVYDEYYAAFSISKEGATQKLINHASDDIRALVIELSHDKHNLSDNWFKKYEISIIDEIDNYKNDVGNSLLRFKLRKVEIMLAETSDQIKLAMDSGDLSELNMQQKIHHELTKTKKELGGQLGSVII